jgi:hypothetical protein
MSMHTATIDILLFYTKAPYLLVIVESLHLTKLYNAEGG